MFIVVLYYRFKDRIMTSRPVTVADRRTSASVHPYPNPSTVAIVLGAQWGDEVRKSIENWKRTMVVFLFREKAN